MPLLQSEITDFSSIDSAFQTAVRHHQAGRLAEAESIYRRVLAECPAHSAALHLLGILAAQVGNPHAAVQLIRRAIAINPHDANAFSDLGNAFQACGLIHEALEARQNALTLRPNSPHALNNLGNALRAVGKTEEALAAYREALRLRPDYADGAYNLGIALLDGCGKAAESIEAFRQSLRLRNDHAAGWNMLAKALLEQGELVEALRACEKALKLEPERAEIYHNLGDALHAASRVEEAVAAYRQALHFKPAYAQVHSNLAIALLSQGELRPAIDACRMAIQLDPHLPAAYTNLAFALSLASDSSAAEVLKIVDAWNNRFARPLMQQWAPHTIDPSPERRLRVGYVSSDFRRHVVGQNLLPFFRQHDHGEFEVYCYASVLKEDAVTAEIRSLSDVWRGLAGLSDQEAAVLIRADQIDILVDLDLHTSRNRLLVFARKPAPVQVTYLGYCGTTGLAAMDYRLSDPYLDPSGSGMDCHSEKTARLPRSYWCYEPLGPTPDLSDLPALRLGHVTFGCLNNFAKVSAGTLELWMTILRKVPGSRLLLQAPAGRARRRVGERFAAGGIAKERLEFVGMQGWEGYLESLSRLDVALDPFPYGGGITSCDALWMGVPVVTLTGKTAVGRGGRSILSNIGLPELVAETPEEYVDKAVALAGDLPRLTELRSTLRGRMERSPLRDAKQHARDIEAAFREMWRKWCNATHPA